MRPAVGGMGLALWLGVVVFGAAAVGGDAPPPARLPLADDPATDKALVDWALASCEATLRGRPFTDVAGLGDNARLNAGVRLELLHQGRPLVDLLHDGGPNLAGNLRTATAELARRLPEPDALERYPLVLTFFARQTAPSAAVRRPFPPTGRLADGRDGLLGWLGNARARLTPTDLWRRDSRIESVLADLHAQIAPPDAPRSPVDPDPYFDASVFWSKSGLLVEPLAVRVIVRLPAVPASASDDKAATPARVGRIERVVPLWPLRATTADTASAAAAAARDWLRRHAVDQPAAAFAPGDDSHDEDGEITPADRQALARLEPEFRLPPAEYFPLADRAAGWVPVEELLSAAAALAGSAATDAEAATAVRLFDLAFHLRYREDPVTGEGYLRDDRGDRSPALSRLALTTLAAPAFVRAPAADAPARLRDADAERRRVATALTLFLDDETGRARDASGRAAVLADRLIGAEARGAPPLAPEEALARFRDLADARPADSELPEAVRAGVRVYYAVRRQEVADTLSVWCERLIARQPAPGAVASRPDEDGLFFLRADGPGAGKTLDLFPDGDALEDTARVTRALAEAAVLFARLGETAAVARWSPAVRRGARALLQRQAVTPFDTVWARDDTRIRGGARLAGGAIGQSWRLTALMAPAQESAKECLALNPRQGYD